MDKQLNISNYKELLKALRHFRKLRGLSQVRLGKRIGLYQPDISDIERGKFKYLHTTTIFKFFDAIGCNLFIRFMDKDPYIETEGEE